MTIRNKLFILLLLIGLIPLIVASVLQQISIRRARFTLSREIMKTLENSARASLKQVLRNYNRIIVREHQLTQALLERQAREVEIRLSQASEQLKLTDITDKDYYLPFGVKLSDVRDDLIRLATMKDVYRQIFKIGPQGILRCYTCLDNGLLIGYPSNFETMYPAGYDGRKRVWYRQAKLRGGLVISSPYIDALIGRTVITVSMPVRRADGSFAGVTAIDRAMPDILGEMQLPDKWAKGAHKMIVRYDADREELIIVMQSSYIYTRTDWKENIKLERLRSQDMQVFEQMKDDIRQGKSGIRKMRYKGREALWVYSGFRNTPFVSVLIIPYERVVELAKKLERSLLSESLREIRNSAILMLLILALAVMLASSRARRLTNPIIQLIEANKKLANGDYAARVEIKTSDELEILGRIFNETGPKLKEHQVMKQSLELARAIQQHLLPKKVPQLQNFDIAGRCRYCDETGGDYYDFIDLRESLPATIGIALGDVTGHGISAAMLMASARSILRNNARHYKDDLSGLVEDFNNQLARDTDDNMFMTLFYGLLNDVDKTLKWASGGHDPAIWYRDGGKIIEELPNTGMITGLMENVKYTQAGPVILGAGDIVVIGTDGIWEAMNVEKEMFGKDRLHAIITENMLLSADEICEKVIRSVTEFCEPASPQDDITLIVIKAKA